MRFARALFVTIIVLCALETVRLWYLAPEVMASHFNAQGNPDGYVSKLEFFGYQAQTALVVLLVSLVLQVLPLLVPPQWINMPNREYWLASPERRAEIVERLSSFGAALFTPVVLVIQAGFELSVLANLQKPIVFAEQLMIPMIVGFFIVNFLLLFWLTRSFRKPA